MKWTEKEIEMLFGYVEADDSETVDERLDFARYMLHNESGFDFPSRSLSAVKSKFYNVLKNKALAKKKIKTDKGSTTDEFST